LPVSRRSLQKTLGLLWLLDAGLQAQPYMFTAAFGRDVLGAAGDGQAGFVATPVDWAARVVAAHPLPWNCVFVLVQLSLGVGLLRRRTAKAALAASIGWGLCVWYLGEGMGGLTGGGTALVTGAPGAALLYALLAAVAWPSRRALGRENDSPSAAGLTVSWAMLWLGGAVLQLVDGPNSGPKLAAAISGGATAAPGWLAKLDFTVATPLGHSGRTAVMALILGQALIGVLALGPGRWRTAAATGGALLALTFWALGQGLGDLTSGQSTDLNTAPLLVIIAVALRADSRDAPRLSAGAARNTRAGTDAARTATTTYQLSRPSGSSSSARRR
jgi:hypothetical protein